MSQSLPNTVGVGDLEHSLEDPVLQFATGSPLQDIDDDSQFSARSFARFLDEKGAPVLNTDSTSVGDGLLRELDNNNRAPAINPILNRPGVQARSSFQSTPGAGPEVPLLSEDHEQQQVVSHDSNDLLIGNVGYGVYKHATANQSHRETNASQASNGEICWGSSSSNIPNGLSYHLASMQQEDLEYFDSNGSVEGYQIGDGDWGWNLPLPIGHSGDMDAFSGAVSHMSNTNRISHGAMNDIHSFKNSDEQGQSTPTQPYPFSLSLGCSQEKFQAPPQHVITESLNVRPESQAAFSVTSSLYGTQQQQHHLHQELSGHRRQVSSATLDHEHSIPETHSLSDPSSYLCASQEGPLTADFAYQTNSSRYTEAPSRKDLAWDNVNGTDPFAKQGHFVSVFGSLEQAREWGVEHWNMQMKHDDTIPRTAQEHIAIVERFYMAMMKIDGTEDIEENGKTPQAWKYFEQGKYTMGEVQALCWELLEYCRLRHKHGILLPPHQRQNKSTAEFSTFEDRVAQVCRALESRKTICKRLLEPRYIHQLVDNPAMYVSRAEQNKRLNNNKGLHIKEGRERLLEKGVIIGKRARSTQGADYITDNEERGNPKKLKTNYTSTIKQSLMRGRPRMKGSPSTVRAESKTVFPTGANDTREVHSDQRFLGLVDPTLGGSGQLGTTSTAVAAVNADGLTVPGLGIYSYPVEDLNISEQPASLVANNDDLNFDEKALIFSDQPNMAATAYGIQMAHADGMFVRGKELIDSVAGIVRYNDLAKFKPLSHLSCLSDTINSTQHQAHQAIKAQQDSSRTTPFMAQPLASYQQQSDDHPFGSAAGYGNCTYVATQSNPGRRAGTIITSTEPDNAHFHTAARRPAKGHTSKRKASDDGAYEPPKKQRKR